jgi:hypothetical protein
MGRVTASRQTLDGLSFQAMEYGYDYAGNLLTEKYPSGKIINNTLDNAGRLITVSGRNPNKAPKTVVSGIAYAAHGAATRLQLGNGRWEHTLFNTRLQAYEIGLGTISTDSSLLKLSYDYGATDNNGTLKSQTITVPGLAAPLVQAYGYDQSNRLLSATETVNG